MEQQDIERNMGNKSFRILSGIVLLIIGILLLGYKMGAPVAWIFMWPILLIALGLLIGVKSKFHNPGALIMILIGGIFFVDQQIPGIEFYNYILPIILISLGLLFILRPKSNRCDRRNRRWERMNSRVETAAEKIQNEENPSSTDDGEYIDVVAVFGGIKKNIQSKNFKGGEIVSFMGGPEINFMQADIQQINAAMALKG